MKRHQLIVALGSLILTACSTTSVLQSASVDPAVTGTVTYGLFEPGRIAVTLGGKAYLQAMLRNHARLIELIEYGAGLPLAPATKRLMEALARSAVSEFAMLEKMEKT